MAVLPAGSVGALVVGLNSSGLNPYSGSLASMPSVDELVQNFQDLLSTAEDSPAKTNTHANGVSTEPEAVAAAPNLDDGITLINKPNANTDAAMHRGIPVGGADAPNKQPDTNRPERLGEMSQANDAIGQPQSKTDRGSMGGADEAKSHDFKPPHSGDSGSTTGSSSRVSAPTVQDSTSTDTTQETPSPPDTIVDYGVVLIGSGDGQYFHGTSYADTLIGNTGTDTFDGGLGDDIYLVHSQDVIIQEAGDAGHDTLITDVSSFHSARNVEVLEVDDQSAAYTAYKDASPIHDGASAAFGLKGGFDTETIVGGYGSDYLQSSGNSTLIGHAGDDLYVYSGRETILEADHEGVDTVLSSVSFLLQDNVENAIAHGGAGIDIEGNALDNLIIGNDQDNVLSGGAGNDVLVSLGGEDQLTGGSGADTFILSTNEISYITDFQADDHLVFAINAPPTALSKVNEFTGLAGEWTFSDGLMQLDWNGDAQVDSQIFLDNVSELNIDMVSVTSAYVSPL